MEAEKKKIRQEYERKEKQVDVRKKMYKFLFLYDLNESVVWKFSVRFMCVLRICSEYSMQLNASRIKVLQAQDDVVNAMKDAAAKELLNVSSDHHVYKRLLKDLIVQVSNSILSLLVRFEKKKKKIPILIVVILNLCI